MSQLILYIVMNANNNYLYSQKEIQLLKHQNRLVQLANPPHSFILSIKQNAAKKSKKIPLKYQTNKSFESFQVLLKNKPDQKIINKFYIQKPLNVVMKNGRQNHKEKSLNECQINQIVKKREKIREKMILNKLDQVEVKGSWKRSKLSMCERKFNDFFPKADDFSNKKSYSRILSKMELPEKGNVLLKFNKNK